jgi:peptide deformylase
MAVREILLLGNPMLYQKSVDISKYELNEVKSIVIDLHDTLIDFRLKYKCGRAIAAPQIGVLKRLIYMNIDNPVILINPKIDQFSADTFEMWDDCMSFPNLLIKVQRYKSCRILYKDLNWNDQEMLLNDGLSELLQHEYDHLEGILAVQRAIDQFSFSLRGQNTN